MQLITGEGQLKVGDKIAIIGKSDRDTQEITVKDVLTIDGNEEIIINRKKNYYFITKLLVEGRSWAKEVRKIQDGK